MSASQVAAAGGSWGSVLQMKAAGSTGNATNHSISPTSTPTSGNLLVLCSAADDYSASLTGWTREVVTESNTGAYLWWKISAGNETTITLTIGSSTSCALHFYEFAGNAASPFDVKNQSAGQTGSSYVTGTTAATSVADTVAIAFISMTSGGSLRNATAWSNSFVEQQATSTTGSGINVRLETAIKFNTATGAQSSTITLDGISTLGSAGIGVFKKA